MSIIELTRGDITQFEVEAIVNAANPELAGGGGVDGAIHRAAGIALLQECQKIYAIHGTCNPGSAVLSAGYKLKARHVIHAVGPIWNGGNDNESDILAKTYLSILELAQEKNIKTLAIPNISTGVYRFPKEKAASIALSVLQDFLTQRERVVFTKIYLVCFDEENYNIYNGAALVKPN